MNKPLFLLIVVLLALLQATLLEYVKFFWVKPDLLLASVVIGSLTFRMRWAVPAALLAGFLKDAMGVYHFGINTLFFPFLSVLIFRLSREISMENDFVRMGVMFISVILSNIVMRLSFLALGESVISVGIFLRVLFIESVYTLLAFMVLARALKPFLRHNK